MLLISSLVDNYFRFRLKSVNYRASCYSKALKKELRLSKLGTILLRNLNEAMAYNPELHQEFEKYFGKGDYQKAFWESDLGYLWYQGNLKQQNKYFQLAISEIETNKYTSHLDVGCGWGELSDTVSKLPLMERAVGIDISEDIIDKAKNLHSGSKATFIYSDVMKLTEHFDIVTIFGSADYINPQVFGAVVERMIQLANKEVIIVNSLRKFNFEETLRMEQAKEVKRYDVGYVQPIKYLLDKLKLNYSFTCEVQRFGLDSSLTIIRKQ